MTDTPSKTRNRIYYVIALTLVGYVSVAWAAYRFVHPDQTETQMFLNFWEAMTWR